MIGQGEFNGYEGLGHVPLKHIVTTVQYAPRAYEWMGNCKATADGMSIAKKGREKDLRNLQDWSCKNVQSFPVSSHSALR